MDRLLVDLDGLPLGLKELSEGLAAEFGGAQITDVEIVPGSERDWPQSHSAELLFTLSGCAGTRRLFFKRSAADASGKLPSEKLRHLLETNRCEVNFYTKFAPVLAARGVPVLRTPLIRGRFDGLEAWQGAQAGDEAERSKMKSDGMYIFMESASGYVQASPVSGEHAGRTLALLACMHAASWEDQALLADAATLLHAVGGTWASRTDEALAGIHASWSSYLAAFAPLAPELLSRPEIVDLARRLDARFPWVRAQMTATATSPFATLLHGDFKAANIFLPAEGEAGRGRGAAVPVDFQHVGVGFGMADVAMHLVHSVGVDALGGGGDERLVRGYWDVLVGKLAEAKAEAFTFERAWRQYRLAALLYMRIILSSFVTDSSPEYFTAQSAHPRAINIGMVYCDPQASLHWVRRVHEYLAHFESEP